MKYHLDNIYVDREKLADRIREKTGDYDLAYKIRSGSGLSYSEWVTGWMTHLFDKESR